ncbi:MAG: transcription antitermination factor NusB [Flavobacteriaceae bacterium]
MITRRHLRTKVMQALYAQQLDPTDNLKEGESWILKSSQDFQLLYITLLDLFGELHSCGHQLYLKNTKKHLAPSHDEINPKFFSNQALKTLMENPKLEMLRTKHKLKYWKNHDEYVRLIWDAITESDVYHAYLAEEDISLEKDTAFLVALFTYVIAPFERLPEFIEEANISWMDDIPLVNTIVRNSLKRIDSTDAVIAHLYKDDEDRKFSLELFRKVALNKTELQNEIIGRTPNWDSERIADLDFTLLLMALAELLYFPSIPVNVTINEYLEIAKEYATPKSSMFINGVLDKLLKDLSAQNRIHKNIRGMQ